MEIGDFSSLAEQIRHDPDVRTSVAKIIDATVARINSAVTDADRLALSEGLRTQRDLLVNAAMRGAPVPKQESEPKQEQEPNPEDEPEG